MKDLWGKLKRVPAAVYAAIVAGIGILILIWRGRRLEAELAQSKIREQKAKAKVHAAEHLGARAVYEKQADQASAEVKALEKEAEKVRATNLADRKRIEGLSDSDLEREYLELAERAKERAKQ